MREHLDQVCHPSIPITPPKKSSIDTRSVGLQFFFFFPPVYKLSFPDQQNPFLAQTVLLGELVGALSVGGAFHCRYCWCF